MSDTMSLESRIAEFTALCVSKIDAKNPSVDEYIENNEVQPIKDAYRTIFGCEPSGATIVRIVGRNCLKEVEPGIFVHSACVMPQYLLNTIALCGVETKVIKGRDIPQWNGPPDMDVRVCVL